MNDTDRNIDLFHKTANRKCPECQNTGTIEYRIETAGHMGSTATRPCHPCQAAILAAWPGALHLLAETCAERDRLAAAVKRVRDMPYEHVRTAVEWMRSHDHGYNKAVAAAHRALEGSNDD